MTALRDDITKEFDGQFVGDSRHRFNLGDTGFLLQLTTDSGARRLELRDNPVRTAGTLEDMLYGEVDGGRTNVEALGMAKVTEVARNGRGKILTIWGDELRAALSEFGYPELFT
jgi:hypothetical protein